MLLLSSNPRFDWSSNSKNIFPNIQSKCLKFFLFLEKWKDWTHIVCRPESLFNSHWLLYQKNYIFNKRNPTRVHMASWFPATWWFTWPLSCCFEPALTFWSLTLSVLQMTLTAAVIEARTTLLKLPVWSEMKTSPDPKRWSNGVLAVFSQRFRGRREVQRSVERGNDALCFPIILTPRSDAHGTRHALPPPHPPELHEEDIQPLEGSTVLCSTGGRLSSNLRGAVNQTCQCLKIKRKETAELNGHNDSQEKPEQMISNQQHFCPTWQQCVNVEIRTQRRKKTNIKAWQQKRHQENNLFLLHHLRKLFCVEEQLDSFDGLKHKAGALNVLFTTVCYVFCPPVHHV